MNEKEKSLHESIKLVYQHLMLTSRYLLKMDNYLYDRVRVEVKEDIHLTDYERLLALTILREGMSLKEEYLEENKTEL